MEKGRAVRQDGLQRASVVAEAPLRDYTMTANMIEQNLVIENRKRLDTIARREYERSELLSSNDEQSGDQLGVVIRSRIEQIVAALRHQKPANTQPLAQ